MYSLLDYLFFTLYSGLVFSIIFMLIRRRHYKGFKKTNRKEGLEIAKKYNGMIRKEVENNHKELFSETLF